MHNVPPAPECSIFNAPGSVASAIEHQATCFPYKPQPKDEK
jgi:hypothetical protein